MNMWMQYLYKMEWIELWKLEPQKESCMSVQDRKVKSMHFEFMKIS